LHGLAWDNEIGLWCYFVGFEHRSNDEKGQSGALVFRRER
jgi:hypothetical protein